MALQLVAAVLLAAWALGSAGQVFAVPALSWIIVTALIGLPLLQLVPLPPAIWQALPGREAESGALNLIGMENAWQPVSLSPARTIASLLAALVPATGLMMVSSLGRSGRTAVIGAIAGCALAGLFVGTAQMAGGEGNAFRFYIPNENYLNGFQANHNSAADVFMIGMVAFAAAVREWSERKQSAASAQLLGFVGIFTALFSVGVVLTASRAGMVLLPIAWLAIAAICWPWLRFTKKTVTLSVVGALLLISVLAAYLLSSGVVWRIIGRFDFDGEFRPELWRDAWYTARQYFPFGAGVGVFVPVFVAAERLEVVDQSMPNRAHNELLETMIETGAVGVVVWTLIGILVLRRAAKLLRAPGGLGRAQIYFAVAAIAVIALHSQVDYPLRSMSLATVAAVAVGMLMPLSRRISGPRR